MKRAMIVAIGLLAIAGAACSSSLKSAGSRAADPPAAREQHDAAALLKNAGLTDQDGAGSTEVARSAIGGGTGGDAKIPALAPAPAAGPGSAIPPLPDRIVKNSDLSIEVRKGSFDEAWSKVLQSAGKFGGYLAAANRAQAAPKEPLRGDITLRIPSARFEAALLELRKFGKVTGDATSTEDVTQQFVDLDARIRNLQAQEAVLLKLMERARTIGETLSVQSPLSRTQEQIEQLTGRRNALRTLTDYSTVTVHLAEPGAAGPAEERTGFSKAWQTAIDGLENIGTVVFVGGIWTLPFAVLAFGAFALRRRFRGPAIPLSG